MDTVTVSSKFQIVLPKLIRRTLEIMPGEKLVVIEKRGIIEMIPIGKMKDARGITKEVSTKNLRDESERFS
ncbi:MAG: AbrB/MazE/SpoVT family DNA-binding domain-containing protein [Candidatus Diapherotrites archaeon]